MSIQVADAPAANSAPNKSEAKASSSNPEYNGNIPCDLIVPDPNNRDRIDPEKIKELAESIRLEGLLQPICVRVQSDGKYMLIAGERRWRAHVVLKRPTIAGRIYRDQDALAAARKKTVENFQREELTPIEEAKKFRELADLGMKQKDIGALLGRSQPVVANAMRLLELPAAVQKLIANGELTMAHGVSLARFSRWSKACEVMAELAIEKSYTSKQIDREAVPFSYQLGKHGLVLEINTSGHDYYQSPSYRVPAELAKDHDFIKSGPLTYCFAPAKWKAEKESQDAERAKKQKASEKREAGRQSKMSPAEKAARQKTIAANKKRREEIGKLLSAAESRLRDSKGLDLLVALLLAKETLAYGHQKFLEPAAKMLGVNLPKGITPAGYGVDSEKLLAMKPEDAIRLVAAAVIKKEAHNAMQGAWVQPAALKLLGGAKLGGGES